MIEQLARQLLLGTRRDAAPATPTSRLTAEALEGCSSLSAEERLLASCAIAAAFESAGFLPRATDQAPPPPAQEDPRPPSSEGAARVLVSALKSGHRAVVLEWVAAAAQAGVRPPHRCLPDLLDLATSRRPARPATARVAGPRGRWLAEKNDAWRWLLTAEDVEAGAADTSVWEEGRLEDRCEYLRALRVRDPARARELLREALAGEKASARARLATELREGLSEADEPFLEGLLSDKSVEVRRAVAGLLCRLPGSALSRRMIKRIEGCVRFERKLLKRVLRVDPPESAAPDLQRDGILDKAAGDLGARATILMQVVAHTPLTWWSEKGRCPPEEILRLAAATDWAEALVRGLSAAATNQADTGWMVALLGWAAPKKKLPVDRDALLRSMPAEDRDDVFASLITAETILDLRYRLQEDAGTARPWSEALTDAALMAARQAVARSPSNWELAGVINAIAPRLHPGRLDDALSGWPEGHENWDYYGDKTAEYFEVVRLRRDLWKELSP